MHHMEHIRTMVWLCLKFANTLLTHICREYENWCNLCILNGKFLQQKSCYPESFLFFGLCSPTPPISLLQQQPSWNQANSNNQILFHPSLKILESTRKRLMNQKPCHDEHSPRWWKLSWRVVRVRPLSCRRPQVPKKQSRCRCGWRGNSLCEDPFWFTKPICFTTQ